MSRNFYKGFKSSTEFDFETKYVKLGNAALKFLQKDAFITFTGIKLGNCYIKIKY